MRSGVIDLGTNTFNLLIAEVEENHLRIIYSEKLPVLLGMDGINEGMIAEAAMSRAKNALTQFRQKCIERGAVEISGIGTSALREASNGQELLDFAKKELSIEIEIVSGMREAELIYQGVLWSFPFEEPTLIMDIGGGSTEFIYADKEGMKDAVSLDIGVSRIYQVLDKPATYTDKHIQQINAFLEENRADFFTSSKSNILVGTSGSFETIFEMIHKCNFPPTINAYELPYDKVMEQLEWIIASTLEERIENRWIADIRKNMLPIAALKMKWVIEMMSIERIFVAPYSLKEGVFWEQRS